MHQVVVSSADLGIRPDMVDTSKGTVHMVIGGGGTSVGSSGVLFNPPA